MKKFLLSFLCFLLAIGGGYAEEVTFNFKTLYGETTLNTISSREVDGITISYAKNSASTAPAFNKDGTLRLYYASSGDGCSATFTIGGNKKITKAVITAYSTSYTPTVKYSVDGSNLVAGTWTDAVMTISDLSASETLMIQNANTSNTQLRIKSVVLTVETITSGGGETPEPESPTITFDGGATFVDAKVVTITAAKGTTIYYTLDGSEPDNNSDEYSETITLKADATLKVIAYDGEYKSDIVEQKFTLASSGTATLVTDAADLAAGDQVVIVASDYDFALSTNQNDNNRGQVEITKDGNIVTLNNDVQILTLEAGTVDNTYAFLTGSGYLYAASSSKNYLRTQTTNNDNSCWKIDIDADGVASIVAQGSYTRNVMRYNQSSSLFSCYSSGQDAVSLYKVKFEVPNDDYVLNVTDAGWATLYLDYAVTIPEGVTCYVASGASGESVQLTEVKGVLPANTAVIVKANPGNYTFKVTGETATAVSQMKGSVKNEYIKEKAYVLGRVDGKVGLYKAEMMGGVFLNNANKAYLPAKAVKSNAKALKFNFDTTGVEGVKVETTGKKVIYDLSGRRVNEMAQPGIYIVNGKKVMVK